MLSHSDIFAGSKIGTINIFVISQTLTPDHFHSDRFRSEDVYPVRRHVRGQLCSGTSGAHRHRETGRGPGGRAGEPAQASACF